MFRIVIICLVVFGLFILFKNIWTKVKHLDALISRFGEPTTKSEWMATWNSAALKDHKISHLLYKWKHGDTIIFRSTDFDNMPDGAEEHDGYFIVRSHDYDSMATILSKM